MERAFSQFVPARYPREILAALQERHALTQDQLAEALALCETQPGIAEHFVSLESLALACDKALQHCDDPWLGLEVGRHMSHARFGALGAAASSCRRAVDMLKLMESFSDTLLPVPSELHTHTDRVDMEFAIPPYFSSQLEFHVQLVVATNFKLLQDSVGYLPRSIVIALPFSRARDYREKLPYQIVYDSRVLCISYPLSYLHSPLLSSDPAARELFLKACEEIALQLKASRTLGASVRLMLANCHEGYPSLEQIADRLHVTTRTLRNRLAAENLSYRELVKQQRVTRAMKLLGENRLKVAEIGEVLGYGDTASFCRAFKRETGMTPSMVRERGQSNPAVHRLSRHRGCRRN